jgi:hypothetical protein
LGKYTYNNEIKTEEMNRPWCMHENEQKLIKVFIGNPEGKRPL